MGWIGEKITKIAGRVAATAQDIPVQRAIAIHAPELREMVAIGVSLGRLASALALAGVVSKKTGKPIEARLIGRMLRAAPAEPPVTPPPPETAALLPSAANQAATQTISASSGSRAGRGLEALAGRRPN